MRYLFVLLLIPVIYLLASYNPNAFWTILFSLTILFFLIKGLQRTPGKK
jgi:hypothetical protein